MGSFGTAPYWLLSSVVRLMQQKYPQATNAEVVELVMAAVVADPERQMDARQFIQDLLFCHSAVGDSLVRLSSTSWLEQ